MFSSTLLDPAMSTHRNVPPGRSARAMPSRTPGGLRLVVDGVEHGDEVELLEPSMVAASFTSKATLANPNRVASPRAAPTASSERSQPVKRLFGNAWP